MKLLVVAKEPVAGRVKTRLCPPLTPQQAADVAAAALHDTLAAAGGSGADHKVLVLDGAAGDWLPAGWQVLPQRGTGLAARLSAAWSDCGGPALQIGMDTPQVTAALLDSAMSELDLHNCVLGPATDGGWWALGMRRAEPTAFDGVPMSVPGTFGHQVRRLRELGLDPSSLPVLTDVDTWSDALEVAVRRPEGRFAAAVAAANQVPDLIQGGAGR